MLPTIGRIVIYNLTEEEQKELGSNNVHAHSQKVVPAMIVRVWSETCVNLKVFGDSNKDIWVTSKSQGDGVSQWNWPQIQK